MSAIVIAAGVGLTLFGVRFFRKGLERLFGGKLLHWLSAMEAKPVRAMSSGVLAGTIMPSSTGIYYTAAQMLGKGRMTSRTMLAMLLGANVGMTIQVQLVATNIEHYAGVLIALGVAGFQFMRNELVRGIGQCLLALGFIFLAMNLISQGAHPLAESAEIVRFFRTLEGNTWMLLVAVSVLTVGLQSATSTIAVGLSLQASGLMSASLLVPWVLGTNIGLGFTSVIVGWSQVESRRLGLGHLLLKLVAVGILVALPGLTLRAFHFLPGDALREAANFATMFNVFVALLSLPLLGVVGWLVARVVPETRNQDLAGTFLDESVLETPPVALARAAREILRMADHVKRMLEGFWQAYQATNAAQAQQVRAMDDLADRMNIALKDYLGRIGDDKDAEGRRWQFNLFMYANELEGVGDLVDKTLCYILLKQEREGLALSAEDRRSLSEVYTRVHTTFELAITLLVDHQPDVALELRDDKETFNNWCRQLQHEHYLRLHRPPAPDAMQLNASALFLDYLNGLRRINSHLSSIGYAFRAEKKAEPRARGGARNNNPQGNQP